MSNDKFQIMCEQVLIPLLANQVFLQLKTLHETLDVIAQDQVRIAARVEQIAATMERPVPTE